MIGPNELTLKASGPFSGYEANAAGLSPFVWRKLIN